MATDNENDEGDAKEPKAGEDGRYDADVVASLRDENARRRVEAKEGEDAFWTLATEGVALRERLLAAEVTATAGAVLADADDLTKNVEPSELLGDDGLPDRDKIAKAAEALAESKPHLKARRVAGDIGQGARGGEVKEPAGLQGVLEKISGRA
jgi:hypothetical protein